MQRLEQQTSAGLNAQRLLRLVGQLSRRPCVCARQAAKEAKEQRAQDASGRLLAAAGLRTVMWGCFCALPGVCLHPLADVLYAARLACPPPRVVDLTLADLGDTSGATKQVCG